MDLSNIIGAGFLLALIGGVGYAWYQAHKFEKGLAEQAKAQTKPKRKYVRKSDATAAKRKKIEGGANVPLELVAGTKTNGSASPEYAAAQQAQPGNSLPGEQK